MIMNAARHIDMTIRSVRVYTSVGSGVDTVVFVKTVRLIMGIPLVTAG